MGQGHGISVLVRAWQITNDSKYLNVAHKAFASYERSIDHPGGICFAAKKASRRNYQNIITKIIYNLIMIITLDKKLLIEPLKAVTGVSEQKHSLAVLGNVLFKISEGELLMVCSDLEVEVSARVSCGVSETIETTIPGKKLLEIVKALSDEEEIKFNIEDTKTTITSGKSKFILATIPAKEFPYVGQNPQEKQKINVG